MRFLLLHFFIREIFYLRRGFYLIKTAVFSQYPPRQVSSKTGFGCLSVKFCA